MAEIFHDNAFWRSRFKTGWPRTFLNSVRAPNEIKDWRRLYYVSQRYKSQSDTSVRIWEIAQWIKEKVRAERGFQEEPLTFYGRALQYYHNDTVVNGRRVERVRVDASLAKFGISYVSGSSKCQHIHTRPPEAATEIVALEFIQTNGHTTTVGTLLPGAKRYGRNQFRVIMDKYIDRRYNSKRAVCPYDTPGVRVVSCARNLRGFRISYNSHNIYSVQIVRQGYEPRYNDKFGVEGIMTCGFEMLLDHVDEVVATFEISFS
ncbi:hypothetical protein BJY04DRAFT_217848 [Aspergillus karnatakaensis]|uniref:uncharacterized protein n=1 Tax=Aspergillus karnatakaensis TaxID=1810916 RepID=UPI003CCDF109